MKRTVTIDCFPESASQYGEAYAVVAIDVIRATTTAITARATGRRCFPVPTIEAAVALAAVLEDPLLAGELGGNMPFGFEMTNSPAHTAVRRDTERPMVLLSSSGTQLIHNARGAGALYLASLRNLTAVIGHLATNHDRVAVIGAGTRGEFREEDQACCAWITEGLLNAGFTPQNDSTLLMVKKWRSMERTSWQHSRSVEYLRRSDQLADLEFILRTIDDLDRVFVVREGEVLDAPASSRREHNLPASATAF